MNYVTTLTNDIEKRIVAQVGIGKSNAVVAKTIGVSSSLLKSWLRTGESHYNEIAQGIKNDDQNTPTEIKDKCAKLWIKINEAQAQRFR